MNFKPNDVTRTFVVTIILCVSPLFFASHYSVAKQGPTPPGATPALPTPCSGHLTRAADRTITMVANKKFYKSTINAGTIPPTKTHALYQTGYGSGCVRWVVEIVVPSTASSGCTNCYDFAEILLGAGAFSPYSTKHEVHFYRPKPSTNKMFCESYKHRVTVYKKLSGSAKFNPNPVKSYYYAGRHEDGVCKVYHAISGGIVHDTSEIYGAILIPDSGTNYYRVVHLLEIDGKYHDSVTVVEFESLEENAVKQNNDRTIKLSPSNKITPGKIKTPTIKPSSD